MCLIVIAVDVHPKLSLVAVANRDEFHRRPTAPAEFWPDAPEVLAGRDREGGGTWLGVTRAGRWAAVTNYRDPESHRGDAASRGQLVGDYLRRDVGAAAYAVEVVGRGQEYNGFGLLVGEPGGLWFVSNRDGAPCQVEAGVHALSNRLLDTPWPKVRRMNDRVRTFLGHGERIVPRALLRLADDREPAADDQLPDTGVGLEMERFLSPPFIVGAEYGTRSSTALLIYRDGRVSFMERTVDPEGRTSGVREYDFRI